MAAELLTPIPSGFLLTANISPLSQSVLQTLHSSISPSQHWWLPISGWGAQGCGMNHLCRSHSILPSTDRSFHSPLTAPYALLLPQLTYPSVRKLPRYRNFTTLSAPPHRGTGPTLLPLYFFSLHLSSYPVTWGSFLSFLVPEIFCSCYAGAL